MGKGTKKGQATEKRLEHEALIAGEESQQAPQYMVDQFQKDHPGIPYGKTLEHLTDPEALWEDLANDPNARKMDTKAQLEESFASLKLASENAYTEMVGEKSGPSADEDITMDDNIVASPAEPAQDQTGEEPWEPKCSIPVQTAGRKKRKSIGQQSGKGKAKPKGKTVHLVRQYKHSVVVEDEDQLTRPDGQNDTYEVEWIGALGLLEDKKGEGLMRVNCKWAGYPLSDNTWEPLGNMGEGAILPETKAEMQERCKARAAELGLTLDDEEEEEEDGEDAGEGEGDQADEEDQEGEEEEEEEEEQPRARGKRNAPPATSQNRAPSKRSRR